MFCAAELRADDSGEMLIGGLNCTACHYAPESAADRLCVSRAPKISSGGAALQPSWIRAFLDNPQQVKPGTAMPDVLAHLSGAQRAETIELLTHFIVSVRSNTSANVETDEDDIAKGRAIYHGKGCVACHAPDAPPPGRTADDATKAELAKLAAVSVPFPNLERKFAVPDLADFLRNPVKAHPSGAMPSLRLDKEEAQRVAMWLLRAQSPKPDEQRKQGLVCDFFDRRIESHYSFNSKKPDSTFAVENISTDASPASEDFSLRFRATITIPRDGEYTFYTRSDDGSWLTINKKLVVDNGGFHAAEEKGGKARLTAGAHDFSLYFFQGQSDSALSVSWEGPDLPKQEIPASAFTRRNVDMKPVGAEPFAFDEAKAERGKQLFVSLNCAVCHPQIGESGIMSGKSLADLAGRDGGCLAPTPPPGVPRYTIPDSGRAAIKAALANAKGFGQPLAPAAQLHRTMTALNCYACHSRAGQGGPQGFRREYFLTNDGKNTDDAKRLPPALDGLGTKHDADWIRRALEEPAGSERMTRMPVYGEPAARLPELFIKADGR